MGKSLIITEKPSVAREYAQVLKVSGNHKGYIENDHYVITWCVGHLVEMVYPEKYDEKYKKWKLEDLPFLPKEYKYDVIEAVRRLADNAGICHVRTKDGSSYAADVQVSEKYNYASGLKTYDYTLAITRVEPEELEGMTLADWQDVHEESE